jgi:hypothetical protein
MENLNNNNLSNNPSPNKKEKVRICPACKQEVLVSTGMHNWKNLFRKPTFEEMITLFIILGVIAIYFAYQYDIKQYQNYINTNCKREVVSINTSNQDSFNNLTNITYKEVINNNQTNETFEV